MYVDQFNFCNMITIEHQDTDLILLHPYTWTGEKDGIYLRTKHYSWIDSVVGNDYKVLINRVDGSLIYIRNEYYEAKYLAIEPSLTGDVLILGMGLALLDAYLVTGTSWKWVENNNWLANNVPITNGTIHEGDAEDIDFLATLGTFDTILIDFAKSNDKIIDYSSLLNVGGTIIEMTL